MPDNPPTVEEHGQTRLLLRLRLPELSPDVTVTMGKRLVSGEAILIPEINYRDDAAELINVLIVEAPEKPTESEPMPVDRALYTLQCLDENHQMVDEFPYPYHTLDDTFIIRFPADMDIQNRVSLMRTWKELFPGRKGIMVTSDITFFRLIPVGEAHNGPRD